MPRYLVEPLGGGSTLVVESLQLRGGPYIHVCDAGPTHGRVRRYSGEEGEAAFCIDAGPTIGSSTTAETAPPTNIDVPAVTVNGELVASAVPGAILLSTKGNWEGTPMGYAFEWRRDETANLGATDTYIVTESDVGATLDCVVSASNLAGTVSAPPSNGVAVAGAQRARSEERRVSRR